MARCDTGSRRGGQRTSSGVGCAASPSFGNRTLLVLGSEALGGGRARSRSRSFERPPARTITAHIGRRVALSRPRHLCSSRRERKRQDAMPRTRARAVLWAPTCEWDSNYWGTAQRIERKAFPHSLTVGSVPTFGEALDSELETSAEMRALGRNGKGWRREWDSNPR